jgi:uncharacterized protein (DUF58 family)
MPAADAMGMLQRIAPMTAMRQRMRQWFLNRLPPSDTLTLTQRNVYILPTRPGWMLGFTLLLLLVASINYQLNLGYLLTFLLAGSAVVGMHVCHSNLRGLTLHLAPPMAVHAGQAVSLEVRLTNERRKPRFGIGLGVLGQQGGRGDDGLAWVDVPAQGSETVHVAWAPERRGRHATPALTAVTLFPLGTFRVWTVWRTAARAMVYPAPEQQPPPLPPGEPQAGHAAASASLSNSGEFDGVRAYRRGDPQKTVVWKKAAQAFAAGRDDLVSRDTLAMQRQQLWLDHATCGTSDLDSRLSRLTAWVLMADEQGLDYGLRLPGQEFAPDHGFAHKVQCLEAMALC